MNSNTAGSTSYDSRRQQVGDARRDIQHGNSSHSCPENLKPSPVSSSSSYICRICHEGDGGEPLVAPCKCTGTVALIHTSCLEHWLTASNSDRCEICKFTYKIVKQPRSCSEYLQDSSNQFNVRNLIADVICFFLLTPLLVVSTYLCALGANEYFIRERWEAVGLVILSLFLLGVYFTWCHVTLRFHISMWKSWQRTNQQIRLLEVHRIHAMCRNHNINSNLISPDVNRNELNHLTPPMWGSPYSRRDSPQTVVILDVDEISDENDTSQILT